MPICLYVVGILALTCSLLYEFVGNIITSNRMASAHGEFVVGRELAAVVHGEVAEIPSVGVVLRHNRIEVMVGKAAGAARS